MTTLKPSRHVRQRDIDQAVMLLRGIGMQDIPVLERAVRWAPKARKFVAAYEADLEEWAEQGYRPERCIHGAYLWVDHDIPCWECEDGGPRTAPEFALAWGYAEAREYEALLERTALLVSVRRQTGWDVSDEELLKIAQRH